MPLHGLAVGEHGYRNAFVVMRGNAGNEHANANSLKNDDRVEYAEPNYLRQIDAINPNLWAFRNPGGLNMATETYRSRSASRATWLGMFRNRSGTLARS